MLYDDTDNLSNLEETVVQTVNALRSERKRFDIIVAQGLSGILVAVPVSLQLRVSVVIVRKEYEVKHMNCHSFMKVVNAQAFKYVRRWLFLDDFISSGATLSRVKSALAEVADDNYFGIQQPKFMGSYLYRDGGFFEWQASEPTRIIPERNANGVVHSRFGDMLEAIRKGGSPLDVYLPDWRREAA